MRKTTTIAAFAALMAVSMPMAFAADMNATTDHNTTTTTPPAATAPMKTSVNATQLQPGQIRASKLKGSDVYDTQNKKIGSIKDIILDKDGQVAEMVIDVDGKDVGVGMHDVKIAMDNDNNVKVTVDKSKEELKSAQAFQLTNETPKTGTSTPPAKPVTTPPAPTQK
ncbi:MAG: PRC-barrel domain-containing protein [Thiohalocapsa sp.]